MPISILFLKKNIRKRVVDLSEVFDWLAEDGVGGAEAALARVLKPAASALLLA
jgi:hypothetical protein